MSKAVNAEAKERVMILASITRRFLGFDPLA